MRQHNVGAPFERIAVDVAGPFPQTPTGNRFILVAIDYFTKWSEVYPMAKQEAETVAGIITCNWLSRFGVPLELHSDQERISSPVSLFQEVRRLLGMKKNRTKPLRPQSDGMVKRYNQLEECLRKAVSSSQRDRDVKLPLSLLAYRSAIHRATGRSPTEMIYGRELRFPSDLLFGRLPGKRRSPVWSTSPSWKTNYRRYIKWLGRT